jgi:hypothetical protein
MTPGPVWSTVALTPAAASRLTASWNSAQASSLVCVAAPLSTSDSREPGLGTARITTRRYQGLRQKPELALSTISRPGTKKATQ